MGKLLFLKSKGGYVNLNQVAEIRRIPDSQNKVEVRFSGDTDFIEVEIKLSTLTKDFIQVIGDN